jgi:DNA-binding beta-propeller fold protein YncE
MDNDDEQQTLGEILWELADSRAKQADLAEGRADVTAARNMEELKALPSAKEIGTPFCKADGLTAKQVQWVTFSDFANGRVVKLAAGSSTQTVLPFTGVSGPLGVAVDSAGNLYVADPFNNRVLKLASASNTPTVVPFTGIIQPRAVAVDSTGNLYVTDPGKSRVAKLSVG